MSTPYDVALSAEAALTPLLATGQALAGLVIDIREPAAVDTQRDQAALTAGGLVILTPETEGWKTLAMGNKAQLALALRVTIVTGGNLQYADRTALQLKHSRREAVRLTLLQRGVLSLGDLAGGTYEPEPAYDASALEKLYRVSKQRFVYIATGDRSTAAP